MGRHFLDVSLVAPTIPSDGTWQTPLPRVGFETSCGYGASNVSLTLCHYKCLPLTPLWRVRLSRCSLPPINWQGYQRIGAGCVSMPEERVEAQSWRTPGAGKIATVGTICEFVDTDRTTCAILHGSIGCVHAGALDIMSIIIDIISYEVYSQAHG
jgi:hypothetical protein